MVFKVNILIIMLIPSYYECMKKIRRTLKEGGQIFPDSIGAKGYI